MRLEDLQVELRPRSPWEAIELGMALVRRHAAAVWRPWLALSLPAFVLANALGWWLDLVPLAAVLMWWLKPVFDRAPLYVLSRAVFGATPGLGETLRAQAHWGMRAMPHYLTWRRLGPMRSLYLPVDLLEGGAQAGERRRVIGGHARGTAALLTLVCANFEMALSLGAVLLVLMFVPFEFLTESARAMWSLLAEQPPPWAQVALNAAAWLATSVVEPFYVGAGFGLYLNRRTRLEAWDVEIAFRRLGRRLLAGSAPLLALALGLSLLAPVRAAPAAVAPASASEPAPKPAAAPAVDLRTAFGPGYAQSADFRDAVRGLEADPLLHPRERRTTWQPKTRPEQDEDPSALGAKIGRVLARIGEAGLWILLAIGAGLLLWTAPRWWPAVREIAQPRRPSSKVMVEPVPEADALPADVVAAARALWHEGRVRRALALVYRASVHGMVRRTGVTLVPGATEAECLRASRALAEAEDRAAFAQAVRVWQHAAYAQRLPSQAEFDALLARLSQRFGWSP